MTSPPQMGNDLAQLIHSEHFEVMEDMGHFPMSENQEGFKGYLIKILDKIINAYTLNGP